MTKGHLVLTMTTALLRAYPRLEFKLALILIREVKLMNGRQSIETDDFTSSYAMVTIYISYLIEWAVLFQAASCDRNF